MNAWRAVLAGLVLVRDALLTLVALPFLLPLWCLPWAAAGAVGRWYGYITWALWPRGRRVGMINLRRATGVSLSRRDARESVRTVFGNLGQSIAEGIQFSRRFKRASKSGAPPFEAENRELERRILEDPRPRILVVGHLGSWELAVGLAALHTDRPGGVVVRRVDNPFLNALWRSVRVRTAAEWIDKHGAAQSVLAHLRAGHDVAMLLDENGGHGGIFVPFFGTVASTRKTPAVLSLASGAPVIVAACIRRPGRPFLYRHALLEPDAALEPADAIRDLTARIVATFEGWIRDEPLQWRWIHPRWKTRPDGHEERYGRADLRRAFARQAGERLPS